MLSDMLLSCVLRNQQSTLLSCVLGKQQSNAALIKLSAALCSRKTAKQKFRSVIELRCRVVGRTGSGHRICRASEILSGHPRWTVKRLPGESGARSGSPSGSSMGNPALTSSMGSPALASSEGSPVLASSIGSPVLASSVGSPALAFCRP